MLNDIMDGVTRKLDELFPECRIYTDEVVQGLELPCFFVAFLEPSEKPMIGDRYYREHAMCIQYHPAEGEFMDRRLNHTAEILMEQMEYITVDGSLVRGIGRRFHKEDGVLSFFVDYNMFVVRKKPPEESMKEIRIN